MKSRREARNEKDMYQKMFNQTQKLESKGKHSKTAGDQDMPKVRNFDNNKFQLVYSSFDHRV